jgi:hypothetical protein
LNTNIFGKIVNAEILQMASCVEKYLVKEKGCVEKDKESNEFWTSKQNQI